MTTDSLVYLHGVSVLACAPDGQKLRSDGDAVDVISAAIQRGAELVALPVERLADEFFTLSTGLAGGITQKFVNYRLRLAIVGDISRHMAQSSALGDFVHEANRGSQLWFVTDHDELAEKLRNLR